MRTYPPSGGQRGRWQQKLQIFGTSSINLKCYNKYAENNDLVLTTLYYWITPNIFRQKPTTTNSASLIKDSSLTVNSVMSQNHKTGYAVKYFNISTCSQPTWQIQQLWHSYLGSYWLLCQILSCFLMSSHNSLSNQSIKLHLNLIYVAPFMHFSAAQSAL